MSHSAFRRVSTLDALIEGQPVAVRADDGERLCLVREGQAVYAMVDRCPHRDFHLSGGDMVDPGVIECPWHGARFDCRTGAVLQGPATDDLTVYEVRLEGNVVYVGPRILENT
ncbi:MAG: Rieske 2Fe-2S domain-containing protein [Phycisphaerae bacterium]|nr:Rieske 2Fe-2S domain-containing protein [Gemmatimonadaceae bacterium]